MSEQILYATETLRAQLAEREAEVERLKRAVSLSHLCDDCREQIGRIAAQCMIGSIE